MDFDDTPQEIEFRARAVAFLEEFVPETSSGPDDTSSMHISNPQQEQAYVQRCRDWQRIKYDQGWAGLTWPEEYGGQGLSNIMDGIFREEEARRISASGVFSVGIGMAGPTIIAHGTAQQQNFFLPRMLKGADIWCQLFSEPNAGSDLGGLRTTAVRDGDEWVVNGQKVWTSGAQNSDWGILLTRTDSEAVKHRGITYFLVDMRTAGIDIRPLVQITGVAHFNEVFLSDVRIPHENVLGEVNGGWSPIMTTLANERTLIGSGGGRSSADDLADLARRMGKAADPVIRQQIAKVSTQMELLKYLGYRTRTAASKGQPPGPESSIMKLAISLLSHDVGNLAMAMCGPDAMLSSGVDGGRWVQDFLSQWGIRIGGGTDNIQRNTIAEKVLGLPAEHRVDKGIPFKDIPT